MDAAAIVQHAPAAGVHEYSTHLGIFQKEGIPQTLLYSFIHCLMLPLAITHVTWVTQCIPSGNMAVLVRACRAYTVLVALVLLGVFSRALLFCAIAFERIVVAAGLSLEQLIVNFVFKSAAAVSL